MTAEATGSGQTAPDRPEILIPPGPQNQPTLCVIESGSRWLKAWRFFLAHQRADGSRGADLVGVQSILLAPDPASGIESGRLDKNLIEILRGQPRAAIFWEISADTLLARVATIAMIRRRYPDCLQLAGGSALRPADLIAISELGVAASALAPEDLPRLASMLQRFMRAQ